MYLKKNFSILIRIVLSISLLPLAGCAPIRDYRISTLMEEGDDQLLARNYSAATDSYSRVLELDAENTALLEKRGELYVQQEYLEKALDDYKNIQEIDPDYNGIDEKIISIYIEQENYEDAFLHIEQAIEHVPENISLLVLMFEVATSHEDQEKYDDALDLYTRIVEIDPNYREVSSKIGLFYLLQLVDYDKVKEIFEVIIDRDPNLDTNSSVDVLPVAYNSMGVVYQYQYEDYQKALAYYKQAVALAPNYAAAQQNIGLTYYNLEDYDAALIALNKVFSLDAERDVSSISEHTTYIATAYTYIGRIHHSQENYDEALANYTKASEFNPDSYDAYSLMGKIYYLREDYDSALESFDNAIRIYPDGKDDHYLRGRILYKNGNYDEAVDAYTRVVELVPEFWSAQYDLGATYRKSKNYSQAVVAYSAAIDLDRDHALSYFNRGKSYAMLGEYSNAIIDYSTALSLEGDNAIYYFARGAAYLDSKQYSAAIADNTRVIGLHPESDGAYLNRSMSHYHLGNYDDAISDFTFLIQQDSYRAYTHYYRGLSHYALGNYFDAISDITFHIQQNGGDEFAYYNRGLAYYAAGHLENAKNDNFAAIRINDKFDLPYYQLGFLADNEGDSDDALWYFNKFLLYSSNDQYVEQVATRVTELRGEDDSTSSDSNWGWLGALAVGAAILLLSTTSSDGGDYDSVDTYNGNTSNGCPLGYEMQIGSSTCRKCEYGGNEAGCYPSPPPTWP